MRVRWRWVAGWLLLTVVALVAASQVEWQGILEAVARGRPGWFLLAVLANAAILPAATAQWHLLLPRGSSVPPRRLFSVVALTASVSNGGPPLAGHAAGIQLLATRGGVGHAVAVSVTVLDQIVEGLAKVALVALAVALVPGFQSRTVGGALLVGVPVATLALVALARRHQALERRWRGGGATPGRVTAFLLDTVGHLEALRRPSAFVGAVALAGVRKTLEALGIWAAAMALDVSLAPWTVLAVLVAVNLSVLVAPTPATLGIYEGAAFLVLRAAGVEADTALALALVAHAAYLLPLAGVGWLLESIRLGRAAGTKVGSTLFLAGLAAVGVAVHLWFAAGADALDTDRALVLLMARSFAEGDFSFFFWQQNYMAALEPLLLMPLALAGWATPVASGLVGMALTAYLAVLSVRLATRLQGATWVTLLLWAVPPALVVHHHVALYGARLAATVLAVSAFAWSLRAARPAAWAGVGALLGAAYLGDHLMLLWAAAVMWVAAGRGGLRPLALGALPLVALDTVAAILTPAAHLSGPNDPGHWVWNVARLFGATLPQLFGFLSSRGPTPLYLEPASLVPASPLWPWVAVPGAVALAAVVVTLARHRVDVFRREDPSRRDAAPAQGLLLACALGLALFAVVGGGGDVWPARYLVPLWPAFSVLAAVAVARWPARARPWAAALAVPALFTWATDNTWPRGTDGAAARAEAAAVGQAVRESGAQAAWADYWDTYRMALLADAGVPWLTLRIIERRPDWVEASAQASPAAYLLHARDTQTLSILEESRARGTAWLDQREVGRYRLVVTERPVPEAVLIPPPPPRWWQMLAAGAAGLLFVGVMGGVALLRLRAPGPPRTPAPPPAGSGTTPGG